MATQANLIRRLRRYIDDTGSGYSQSAPEYSTDLSALDPAITEPTLRVQLDGGDEIDVLLGVVADLKTGQAIAAAIQASVRAADPLLPDATTPAFSNFSCTYDSKDGYTLASGSLGSGSIVRVMTAVEGDDAAEHLCLGLMNGGYETTADLDYSDQELGQLLDEALASLNAVSSPSTWTYDTLPSAAELPVLYRAWSSIVDIKLGQSSDNYWQRVEQEEDHKEQIFSNLLKLAKWLTEKIAELDAVLGGGNVEVVTVSRWDYQTGQIVPTANFEDKTISAAILTVQWLDATSAVLEFSEILSTGFSEINIGYSTSQGVIDRSVYTDPEYDSKYYNTKGFVSPSVLARTLRSGRDTVVKLTGLDSSVTTYFALMAVDVNGYRYFSPEYTLESDA